MPQMLGLLLAPFLFSFSFLSTNCEDVPPLNKEIVAYVKTQVNKKVGRGECWDLAAEALNTTGADWDKDYGFGDKVNVKKNECVFPGDIIQFEKVRLDYRNGNSIYCENLAHHTAIIYEV